MVKTQTLWVIVANSCCAEIFSVNGKSIAKVEQIDFPKGRERGRDVYSDRPGRGFESMSGGTRHALSSEVDLHWHDRQVFAHQVSALLHKAKSENAFDSLVLIAPPEFLGELRLVMDDPVKKTISKEFTKELPPSMDETSKIAKICKLLDIQKGPGESPWKK